MTQEQIEDRGKVWAQMAKACPEFTRKFDIADNYHAVREIVLGGSVGWAGVHERFKPTPVMRVMDIGANAGIFSAFCALKGAHVTAFEPFPAVFELLAEMIYRTGFHLITPIHAAIWVWNGVIPYVGTVSSLDGACQTYNGGVPTEGSPFVTEDFNIAKKISCITLDRAVGDNIWDCVKMDIEGAEFEVLLAAAHETLRRIKFMYVEFHPWASQNL